MSEVMKREKGPIEILCDEIGFRFRLGMETKQMLLSFARVLLEVIDDMRSMEIATSRLTGKTPSVESAAALTKACAMLEANDPVSVAAEVHSFCDEANPESAYPTDHYIDMVSSCVSIVRFGFESPCHSRHAASAADHIWRLHYGITLQDRHTGNWCKDWTRSMLELAILRQIPSPTTRKE